MPSRGAVQARASPTADLGTRLPAQRGNSANAGMCGSTTYKTALLDLVETAWRVPTGARQNGGCCTADGPGNHADLAYGNFSET